MDTWQHPLEQPEPALERQPRALPSCVLDALQSAELPCLLYRPSVLRRRIQTIMEVFPHYYYPMKCNPCRRLVETAVVEGAGLDVCSPPELDLALAVGTDPALISYTGLGLCVDLMRRLAKSGAMVNLDSIRDLEEWVQSCSGYPVGLRLKAGPQRSYRAKFGIAVEHFDTTARMLRSTGTGLRGIHVHFGHGGRSGAQVAAALMDTLVPVLERLKDLVAELEYVNLGGGWPVLYGDAQLVQPKDVADSLHAGLLAKLKSVGFSGQIAVEPGEFAVADCGYWAAQVVATKDSFECDHRSGSGWEQTRETHGRDQQRSEEMAALAVLDTTTPIPSAAIPYPVHVLRSVNGRLVEVRGERSQPYRVVGITNSPFDTIRKRVLLPPLARGDVLVMGRTGAYLRSLIGRFHLRAPPAEYVLET